MMIKFDTNKNVFTDSNGQPLSLEALGSYSESYLEKVEEASRILSLHPEGRSSHAINVYVADLHAYNCGRLNGRWFDLSEFHDEYNLHEAIEAFMTLHGEGEEWAVHDYESPLSLKGAGEFSSLKGLETLMGWQEFLAHHGAEKMEAMMAYCEDPADLESLGEALDRYMGAFSDEREWAMEFVEEIREIMSSDHPLFGCLDWDHVAEEIRLGLFDEWGYTYIRSGGNLHVFAGY